ncbi:peptide chain release factor N(5)-glutamine methyltransferase [Clostridium tertium]|jgi:release factor-specific protein-(glutamine-N5) methyltransferase|uniref:Release factor glutamine methyltransferase n=2 Tax=Clostridium TaxID=1485 RepID=A0A9X3XM27_9CLOT|nr:MULTISPECIES: peptide chain release factor N(5)-glutamine methyltransferase [Clostridium]EEH99248.1 protein-(glutamine-N5) methyltransferase, release factor-specific [Clostridium sp. 7_2_43FAA]MDB1949564.1 peptide chain release factor N(5)-glutamine methyltransferase [Clostridium tertium]MDB1956762.1 peptide chain release factor N(5)-glutamine methyltransferase [Clostridium tertium]MDB1960197.1 peptide chain release factor N(5)-glutamine methyltransferase [Clostridium tertium]MDB1962950.1 p
MRKCEVGGQAVIEGVMMRGSKGQATAVRTPNKEIRIDFKKIVPITKKYKFLNVPFIRGIFVLVDSLITGINTLNYSASFFEDEDESESKFEIWLKNKFGERSNDLIIGATMILSFAIAVGLFVALPTAIASLFSYLNLHPIALNLIEAVIRMVILLGYMYSISKMEDIYRVFQYHGAEHKSIFCYEAEEELTVDNVKKFSRFHPRCGTNFLFLIMFVSILIFSFTGWGGFLERLILRILLIPVVSGITYELIKWLGKNDNKLAKIIAYPGLKLQELTTKEPDDDQIEVAIAALMKAEGLKPKEKTIGELLDKASKELKEENIDTYILDAQLLLGNVLAKDKLYIITNRDKNVSLKDEKEYFELIEKRKNKMPIKYILGETEFMGLDFNVEEGVLIPRGDTEILVEEVLSIINEEDELNVCDLCSGSGAIGISIANYRKKINVEEIDFYEVPEKVTKKNIIKHGLESRVKFIKSDLLKEPINQGKKYDVIVSNPPYIKADEISNLMDDVKKYEPHTALDGGDDGLVFYKRIIEESKTTLNNEGVLAFEIGYDQGEEVSNLMKEAGFYNIKLVKDLAGLDRVVLGYFKY